MIIGLMALPNKIVYIQFHPVAYMVKLNIEMCMASLIVRLSRSGSRRDTYFSSNFDFRSRASSAFVPGMQRKRPSSAKSIAPLDTGAAPDVRRDSTLHSAPLPGISENAVPVGKKMEHKKSMSSAPRRRNGGNDEAGSDSISANSRPKSETVFPGGERLLWPVKRVS
jgi:hypothetical protein